MQFEGVNQELSTLISANLHAGKVKWLEGKLSVITANKSTKDLYLTYSLLASKIDANEALKTSSSTSEVVSYLKEHNATLLQTARIYLLAHVLIIDKEFFVSKVANIFQVADTSELETFLKFLVLLPNSGDYKVTAVDTLRTNIETIFDAIALHNPYPSLHFNDQQWNQMYLKAAFLQRDLHAIIGIDKRANKELTRIISDYAHERWAASRDIEPYFWRPVSNFIEGEVLNDMKRLFKSENRIEQYAAALCCYASDKPKAKELLGNYPKLLKKVENKEVDWGNFKG